MDGPPPGHHLLVASTGGHLAQLHRWSEVIGSDADSLWVTFENPQSESLLRNRRKLYVPYVAPRDGRGTIAALLRMMREIDWKAEGFTAMVTTGAALGLAGLTAARLHRIPATYIESVSRVRGPSLTGKLASLDPSIQMYCQYEHWANERWKFHGSLFDTFETVPKSRIASPRLFVTLGTIQPYRFDALVDAVLSTGLADSRTVWQLGATTREGLAGRAHSQLSASEFESCARAADVVITHAGVGTLMQFLEMGIFPVVVPRRADRKEHVDDHQVQIVQLLQKRRIAIACEVNELNAAKILEASSATVVSRSRS
jgi:UDP-N-acetylglucosamine transferase subunit ALG13